MRRKKQIMTVVTKQKGVYNDCLVCFSKKNKNKRKKYKMDKLYEEKKKQVKRKIDNRFKN